MLTLVIFLAVLLVANSLNVFKPSMLKKSINLDLVKASSLALITSPMAVLADDGASPAFAFPLAISLLTMVPFLYYQQALKPKDRSVKQIELDENGREVAPGKGGAAAKKGGPVAMKKKK